MPEKPCPNQENDTCPCTSDYCPRHGRCCECLRAHLASDSLPACCRDKAQIIAK